MKVLFKCQKAVKMFGKIAKSKGYNISYAKAI